jgi:hypothetical protein
MRGRAGTDDEERGVRAVGREQVEDARRYGRVRTVVDRDDDPAPGRRLVVQIDEVRAEYAASRPESAAGDPGR